MKELHIDRAYLSSHLVRERPDELEVYCKAWPVHQGKGFHKQAFVLDWQRQTIQCPAKQEMPFAPGGTVHFPKETCDQCPLKSQCTTSSKGRSVSIHPDEALLIELRQRQQTPQGRAKLRERVAIEHTLAHVGWWQGRRARYRGVRKNLFDLRRCPSSTICTSWLVPSSFRLSFKMLLDYLTDALGKGVCMTTLEVKSMEADEERMGMMKLEELLFEGKEGCSMARRDVEFTVDGAQVGVDCAWANDQGLGDLSVRKSLCHQPQHLDLAGGEAIGVGWSNTLV